MSILLVREKFEFANGIHTWKVKVHKSCSMIAIGVCTLGKATGWWYCSTGCTVDNTGSEAVLGPKFEDFTSMDFISVKLDIDAQKIYFGRNDEMLELAFSGVPSGPFCPTAKISGFNVTQKDVQFIHEDGGSKDITSLMLDGKMDEAGSTEAPFACTTAKVKKQAGGPEPQILTQPEAKSKPEASAKEMEKVKAESGKKHEHDCKAHKHEVDHHKHDKATSADDGSRPKPAWVDAAGRLLHNTKTSASWCKGHGPMFKTKKGSCSRCECLPCPECVHAFQNIRDTLLSMLTKYHCEVDTGTLMNYSLMFTGLKKNGDVKVDVHHRCCAKHKQRFISSLTINTCCRKHKVETCERIVQTLKENARSNRPNETRHESGLAGDDFGHDIDELETDDMEEEEEEEDEEHGDLEGEESSAHSSDSSHKAEATPDDDEPSSLRSSNTSGVHHGHNAQNQPKGSRHSKKRGKR
eukprot:GGOE01041056.1.p1 GENE.GGOE01041056.1~~GGOE01041056.1.p1  ORF type:complete len:466 (-),score=92.94 GGOE01041056.1:338-1735(-)